MSATTNRQVVLARRPAGALVRDDFAIIEAPVPEPGPGQLLLRNLYLSIDPYLRGRMDEGESYAPPFVLGAPPAGTTLGEVTASADTRFRVGDRVVATGGWQHYAVVDADEARAVPGLLHPTWALGPLGMTGFTAWYGTSRIGRPQAGETVVVLAASGAVGSVAGEVARLRGARVVGIAGGAEKCRHVVDDLGFDACVDRERDDLVDRLAEATPGGIDVYFENVGGKVFDAIWPRLNEGARVPVCGVISGYDGRVDAGTTPWSAIAMGLITKRIHIEGFMNADHAANEWDIFKNEVGDWLKSGALRVREDITNGLDQAPDALMRVLTGHNFGKTLVRL